MIQAPAPDLGLPIVDWRRKIPRAQWEIGRRSIATSQTWHYNGPAVAEHRRAGEQLLQQLINDAAWQMRPGWGGTVHGADGLMYHYAVDAEGVIYQLRDYNARLWHCAHADGNANGLALHVPIGADQVPTIPQLASLVALTQAICTRESIPWSRVYGHLEWKHLTACPGPHLMRALQVERNGGSRPPVEPTLAPGIWQARIKHNLTLGARFRTAPNLAADVAGKFKAGTEIYCEPGYVQGDGVDPATYVADVDGDRRWVKLAHVAHQQAPLGYLSRTLLESAP